MATEYRYVKDATGKQSRIKASDWKEFEDSGEALNYEISSAAAFEHEKNLAKHETAGQTIAATAEGVGRGLTFGGTDMLLGEVLGDAYSEGARFRRDANPFAAGAGEAVGSIAPLLLSGGTGAVAKGGLAGAAALTPAALVARGAAAAGRTVGGRVGAGRLGKAVGLLTEGAIEGAVGGAGMAGSEASLQNVDITAEQILAGAGSGGLFGASVGGVAGTLIGGGSAAAKRFSRLFDGDLSVDIPGMPKGALRDAAEELANESTLKATGARGSAIRKLRTEENVHRIGQDMRVAVLEDGTRVMRAGDGAGDLVPRLRKWKSETSGRLNKARDRVFKAGAKRGEMVNTAKLLDRIDNEVLNPLYSSSQRELKAVARKIDRSNLAELRKADAIDPKTLHKMHQDLKKVVYPDKGPGGGITVATPAQEQLRKVERIMSNALDEETQAIANRVGVDIDIKQLKRETSSAINASKLADEADMQDLGNRAVSISDYMSGGAAASIGATVAGPIGAAIGGAVGATANKIARERGRSVVARVAEQAAGLSTKLDTRIEKHVAKAIKREPRGKRSRALPAVVALFGHRGEREDNYRETVKEVRELAGNPQLAMRRVDQLTAAMGGKAPGVAMAMGATAIRQAQFLASRIPTQPMQGSITPQLETESVSASEMAEWAELVEVIQNPERAIDALEDGTLSYNQVDALKAGWPLLYEQMRATTLDQLLDAETRPAYNQRLQLSLLLDIPGDATLSQEHLRSMSLLQVDAAPEDAPRPGRSPNIAGAIATGTENTEARMSGS